MALDNCASDRSRGKSSITMFVQFHSSHFLTTTSNFMSYFFDQYPNFLFLSIFGVCMTFVVEVTLLILFDLVCLSTITKKTLVSSIKLKGCELILQEVEPSIETYIVK